MRWFTPSRLAAGGLFLLGAAAFVVWLLPASGTDIRLVDPAHPVDQIVSVPHDARTPQPGPIYFVDVREREARLLERLLPFARPSGSTPVDPPPGRSAGEPQVGGPGTTGAAKGAAVPAVQHP